MEGETGWERGEAGKDTSIEWVQGKKGRELSNKEGKKEPQKGLLLGFEDRDSWDFNGILKLKSNRFLDWQRQTNEHRLSHFNLHMVYIQYM